MPGVLLANQPVYVKSILADVQWTTASAKEFKAARGKLTKDGLEVISLTSTNPQTKEMINYGVTKKANLAKQGHTIALGAWLANTFKTGTVLALEKVEEAISEDFRFWLCIVNDGQVVTGTDALFEDWNTAAAVAESTIDALGAEEVGYVGTEASQLSFNRHSDEPPQLADVLSKSALQKSRFKSVDSQRSLIIIGSGALVLACLCILAYHFINKSMVENEVAERADQRREAQRTQAQEEFQTILNEVGSMSSAGATAGSWWDSPIKPAITSVDGWKLVVIICETGSCAFDYDNTNLTLPGLLKAAIGSRCSTLAVVADGTKAKCAIGITNEPLLPAKASNGGQVMESQVQSMLLDESDIDKLLSDFMTVSTLGEGTSYAINSAIEYPFRGSRYLPLVQMWNQGEWGLTFPIEYIEAVSAMLARYRGVALTSLKINWSSRIVELQGLYFSKKVGAE